MDGEAIDKIIGAVRPALMAELGPDHRIAFVPEGMTIHDLKGMMPPPERVKQKVTLLTVVAFVGYVNRFAAPSSTIFADETKGTYDAVIDFHDPGKRGTLDHVAQYACPESEQWKAWTGNHKKWVDQVEFAQFLESNLRDITSPVAAQFIEVVLNLQGHKSAEFSSEVSLENGQTRFMYNETVRSGKKTGHIDIPTAFELTIPVFVDGTQHKLEARFRYKVEDGGKLRLSYELIRHIEVRNNAIKVVTAEVLHGVKAKNVHLYAGSRG